MQLVRVWAVSTALFIAAASASAQAAETAMRAPEGLLLATNEVASEGELEYWRSAQRIDTPAAYRSYLDAFPKGFFAALAKMKLAGDGAPASPARPAAASAAPAAADTGVRSVASLRYFSAPLADSGAIEFNLGDRLNGPGLLMVGSLGARKQIVIPGGEWVLLAAVDSKVAQSASSVLQSPRANLVALTSLVLGRFTGNRLTTLLRFTTNTRLAKVSTWSDLDTCVPSAGTTSLEHASARTGLRDECSSLRLEDTPLGKPFAASEETSASLARLGATVSGAGLVSTLSFAEPRLGYLGITRIDFPGAALGPAADKASAWRTAAVEISPAREAYLKRLGDWARSYRGLAATGFQQGFEGSGLVANAPARASAELSGLVDF